MAKLIPGLLLGALCAALIACASGKRSPMSATPTSSDPPAGDVLPEAPRTEIDRLAGEIEAALVHGGLASTEPPVCAVTAACGTTRVEPLSLQPYKDDTTCKPAASETCTSVCTLSDSICKNAERICTLATQLGGEDGYANEKCMRGNDACRRARARCCGCT